MVTPKLAHKRIFLTERFNRKGGHLVEMRRRQFGKTPVNDRVEDVLRYDRSYPVKEMCFGDPSLYPGMGPYEGLHRHLRRYLNFQYDARVFAAYEIWGDPQFKEVLKRGSAQFDEDYVSAPADVMVYPTFGVAGALRMLCPALILPPAGSKDEFLEEVVQILKKMVDEGKELIEREDMVNPYLSSTITLQEALKKLILHFQEGLNDRENAVVPKWTYLSHSAEVAFAQGEVRTCDLTRDGQVDLKSMFDVMDNNTRAVILSTVGNPLATAMSPGIFDDMVQGIYKKMIEYGHPIVLVADVIYEHFRRNRTERIDPVHRVLKADVEVPVIETSSFSKMFGIPGYRLGFFRVFWKPEGMFEEERDDLFTAIETIYGTTLCPVPSILQKATSSLFIAINSRYPIEEELAPVAAVLTALKELTDMKGKGDTHTMMPDEVPEEILARLGVDPTTWFTTSAIAKRSRKLANMELGKYNVDIETRVVEKIGKGLENAGMIEVKELEIRREKMLEILTSAIMKYAPVEHKLASGLDRALPELRLELSDDQKRTIISRQLAELHNVPLRAADMVAGEVEDLQMDFGIQGSNEKQRTVRFMLYKLSPASNIPDLPRYKDGKIKLEGISEASEWREIAKRCKIPTEDEHYNRSKRTKRKNTYERTDYFMRRIDEMAKKGLGVYLHPAYYNEYGELVPERVNAFYILFGFDKLRSYSCQAAELVSRCKAYGKPLLSATPGEVFLPFDERSEDESYIRTVSLDRVRDMDEILDIIEHVANNLAAGEVIPYKPGGFPLGSYKKRE